MSTDFFVDLERELVGAARRRANASRRRSRPRLRPAIAVVALLSLAIAATALVVNTRDRGVATPVERGAAVPAAVREPVTVLNGTTSDGLGLYTAELLRRAGYGEGRVDNWRSQTVARSRAAFLEGGEAAAVDVADALRIGIVRRARPAARQVAGGARVVVILGSDLLSDMRSRVQP